MPQAFVAAPLGGVKTVMSPTAGSLPVRCEKRSTRMRWPGLSVGSIEPDGMRYGLIANAWIVSAKKIAAPMTTIISSIERIGRLLCLGVFADLTRAIVLAGRSPLLKLAPGAPVLDREKTLGH